MQYAISRLGLGSAKVYMGTSVPSFCDNTARRGFPILVTRIIRGAARGGRKISLINDLPSIRRRTDVTQYQPKHTSQ